MIDAITIDYDEFDTLILCAFRYALGRKTYITSAVADIISSYSELLQENTRQLICKEIIEGDDKDCLGQECDRESWLKLLKDLND